jgi:hypothetical protein
LNLYDSFTGKRRRRVLRRLGVFRKFNEQFFADLPEE